MLHTPDTDATTRTGQWLMTTTNFFANDDMSGVRPRKANSCSAMCAEARAQRTLRRTRARETRNQQAKPDASTRAHHRLPHYAADQHEREHLVRLCSRLGVAAGLRLARGMPVCSLVGLGWGWAWPIRIRRVRRTWGEPITLPDLNLHIHTKHATANQDPSPWVATAGDAGASLQRTKRGQSTNYESGFQRV